MYGPVSNCEYSQYDFQVIDRWGHVLFRSIDPALLWNGGGESGYYAPDATYTWLLSYRFKGASSAMEKQLGSVNVLR